MYEDKEEQKESISIGKSVRASLSTSHLKHERVRGRQRIRRKASRAKGKEGAYGKQEI